MQQGKSWFHGGSIKMRFGAGGRSLAALYLQANRLLADWSRDRHKPLALLPSGARTFLSALSASPGEFAICHLQFSIPPRLLTRAAPIFLHHSSFILLLPAPRRAARVVHERKARCFTSSISPSLHVWSNQGSRHFHYSLAWLFRPPVFGLMSQARARRMVRTAWAATAGHRNGPTQWPRMPR